MQLPLVAHNGDGGAPDVLEGSGSMHVVDLFHSRLRGQQRFMYGPRQLHHLRLFESSHGVGFPGPLHRSQVSIHEKVDLAASRVGATVLNQQLCILARVLAVRGPCTVDWMGTCGAVVGQGHPDAAGVSVGGHQGERLGLARPLLLHSLSCVHGGENEPSFIVLFDVKPEDTSFELCPTVARMLNAVDANPALAVVHAQFLEGVDVGNGAVVLGGDVGRASHQGHLHDPPFGAGSPAHREGELVPVCRIGSLRCRLVSDADRETRRLLVAFPIVFGHGRLDDMHCPCTGHNYIGHLEDIAFRGFRVCGGGKIFPPRVRR
mmetsp:Transcript_57055/g.121236  ORF Transcript_57055/g.121236 Transcript_57055/m.121236 type:complete len:319 (-) Transcript_57055:314-1270(-)